MRGRKLTQWLDMGRSWLTVAMPVSQSVVDERCHGRPEGGLVLHGAMNALRIVSSVAVIALMQSGCGGAQPVANNAVAPSAVAPAAPEATTAKVSVATTGFADGAKHFRDAKDDASYARHAEDQVSAIAGNILLHQRSSGGWATNWDPRRVLSDDEAAQLELDQSKQDTSFDNRTTYTQIEYLATAFQLTRDERFRDAALRGLHFTLKAQHASGGFTHSYPGEQDYHHHITFMDDVMPGVLKMLRQAASGGSPYEFLDAAWRGRLGEALKRGNACLLKLQVVAGGSLTAWAGQYDAATLLPTNARSFELASLVSDESVTVVEYLMSIDPPPPEVVRAIDAAVRWFERSKITGIRVEQIEAPTVRYKYHTSSHDLRVVADPAAPPLWARFYELDTNRPFMANRDGVKVYSLDQVERERRTGYRWYGEFAKRLLEQDYPAWQRRWARVLE
jgi:PelA/Pel-15E family pectate lyase